MQSALADSIHEERRALMRFAKHLSGSTADAEDLVQEALLRMWSHSPEFPSEGHRRAWLKRVVLNGHIDRRRRDRRARDWMATVQAEPAFGREVEASRSLSGALQRSLDSMPRDFRDVLVLVDLHEHSYQETAAQLACPVGTVMSRLHRARHQLRASMGREEQAASLRVEVSSGQQAAAA